MIDRLPDRHVAEYWQDRDSLRSRDPAPPSPVVAAALMLEDGLIMLEDSEEMHE